MPPGGSCAPCVTKPIQPSGLMPNSALGACLQAADLPPDLTSNPPVTHNQSVQARTASTLRVSVPGATMPRVSVLSVTKLLQLLQLSLLMFHLALQLALQLVLLALQLVNAMAMRPRTSLRPILDVAKGPLHLFH